MTDTITLEITNSGVETLARMNTHVDELARYFGEDSPEHRKAEQSLRRAYAHLIQFGSLSVWRDGDLSLVCQQQPTGLTFGVIFSRVQPRCTTEGCGAYMGETQPFYYTRPEQPIHDDTEHLWSYPPQNPTPGEWSFHS